MLYIFEKQLSKLAVVLYIYARKTTFKVGGTLYFLIKIQKAPRFELIFITGL